MAVKREVPPKDVLVDLYQTQRLGLREVAKRFGGSTFLIMNWLQHYNIATHPSGTNLTTPPGNHVAINGQVHDILVGELLGDGCVCWGDAKRKQNSLSGVFTYSTSKLAYLKWLFSLLGEAGINLSGTVQETTLAAEQRESGFYTLKPTTSFKGKTLAYRELRAYRAKWYPNEVKSPPTDLVITPTVLLHWFLGDGTLQKITSRRPRGIGEYQYSRVVLCTNGFTWEECEMLASKLQEVGLQFEVKKHHQTYKGIKRVNPQLHLPKAAVNTPLFFAYIGECPPELAEVYGYKWDWNIKRVDKVVTRHR